MGRPCGCCCACTYRDAELGWLNGSWRMETRRVATSSLTHQHQTDRGTIFNCKGSAGTIERSPCGEVTWEYIAEHPPYVDLPAEEDPDVYSAEHISFIWDDFGISPTGQAFRIRLTMDQSERFSSQLRASGTGTIEGGYTTSETESSDPDPGGPFTLAVEQSGVRGLIPLTLIPSTNVDEWGRRRAIYTLRGDGSWDGQPFDKSTQSEDFSMGRRFYLDMRPGAPTIKLGIGAFFVQSYKRPWWAYHWSILGGPVGTPYSVGIGAARTYWIDSVCFEVREVPA